MTWRTDNMGKIHDALKEAGRLDRFYVKCNSCGAVVLDSAKELIPSGQPEYVEAVATTAIRSHNEKVKAINIQENDFEYYDCDSFAVVIEKTGQPCIDPTSDSELDVELVVE